MEGYNHKYVDVILPVAVPNLYTYHFSSDQEQNLQPGMRVCVQFGKRRLYTALVARIHEEPPKEYKTKEIVVVLDDYPIIYLWQIDYWKWIAQYYMCTIGEVFIAALPVGLRPEGQTKVFLKHLPSEGINLSQSEELVVSVLEKNPGITIDEIQKLYGQKQIMPILRRLSSKNFITYEESLKDKYKPITVDLFLLHAELQKEQVLNELINYLEKRAPKQCNVLLAYLDLCGYTDNKLFNPVYKSKLAKRSKASPAVFKTLVDKNIFKLLQQESSRLESNFYSKKDIAILSDIQKEKFNEIKSTFKEKDIVLLHGVTSSGKTEIYIHLIQEQIDIGKQVLYLLPEIALTTQIISRLREVFGNKVGIYHSKYSNAERVETWNNLLGHDIDNVSKYDIILGVRSSVLLPFENLGLIIVDEEHENTYKQFDPAPRYNARDISIVLAAKHNAKVLLGTATPSLESIFNVNTGKYGIVQLFQRHLDIKLPEIEIVNTRELRRKKQMSSLFSPPLISNIQEALNKKEQIILFQNRRGFSPYLECEECGWIPNCQHCDVNMTYHKGINKLVCHYCGYNTFTVIQCKACRSSNIQTRGFGTQKIEDDIKILFPDARVQRMDLDSTRRKKAYEELINSFTTGEIDILIGTQMVSKGLDFDNVSIVGIMNADNMLNFPDFRAYERSFQLMSQVSGRAGRKKKQGKVIIQTGDPTNCIIKHVVDTDYDRFFLEQLAERKQFKYPPFYRLIRLTLKHKQKEQLNKAALQLSQNLKEIFGARILGPEEPLIGRIQNWYLKHLIIKLEKTSKITDQKLRITQLINSLNSLKGYTTLQVLPDVDPY